MENKISVSSLVLKNGWYNIKTTEGKEVSILEEKNPKIKKQLEDHKDDISDFLLDCKLVEKNGKNYGWDLPDANQSKFFGAKKSGSDESFGLSYSKDISVAIIEKGKIETPEEVIARAEKFYQWLKSKK